MKRLFLSLILILSVACTNITGIVAPEDFNREVKVFDVRIWATECVTDTKLLHAGNVLAQYLDNNGDGEPDKTAVTSELSARNATIIMFGTRQEAEAFDLDKLPSDITAVQFLYSTETNSSFKPDGANSYFDGSLQKVLHLITTHGYANAWSDVFGECHGSKLSVAMDSARGGYFPEIPAQYPEGAWYTNNDQSCDYEAQVARYFYWALTSRLGAQDYPGRFDEIKNEWQLNTPGLVTAEDPQVTEILSNPDYGIPQILPDGNYQGFEIKITDLDCST
ncbi:MAG: hypothetical protein KAR40_09415 [Candidatus Sabulitectum sp.]|nr:hypothetical protein [Candidatus Sabulitectum sp.]